MNTKTKTGIRRFCKGCQQEIELQTLVCPHCEKRIADVGAVIQVNIEERLLLFEELKIKQKRPGYQKPVVESKQKDKIAGESKRLAKEELTIDRINRRKIHKVWEQNDAGEWELVHDEDVEL